jgi:hypothetical protein
MPILPFSLGLFSQHFVAESLDVAFLYSFHKVEGQEKIKKNYFSYITSTAPQNSFAFSVL